MEAIEALIRYSERSGCFLHMPTNCTDQFRSGEGFGEILFRSHHSTLRTVK